MSEVIKTRAPSETTFEQLVAFHIKPHFHGQIDETIRFMWFKWVQPPRNLTAGYEFKVTTSISARGNGIGMAKLKVEDYQFNFQIRRDAKIGDLLRVLCDYLIQNGRCGNVALDVEEGENIDFERVHIVTDLEKARFPAPEILQRFWLWSPKEIIVAGESVY
jgi:hypothetical protein